MYLNFNNYFKKNSFLNWINKLFLKRKTLILSILIFIIIIFFLGLPYTKWGFFHDDFGFLWRSQLKSFNDFIKLFYEGSAHTALHCSNYNVPKQTFFFVYYRPLIFFFYYLQSLFFKINPYYYFLFIVFLHAVNSIILFNILLYFSNYLWAFLGALFFAFHSSLIGWFGWIGGLQHYIILFLFFCIIFSLKKYLNEQNIIYYIAAVLLYLLALFNREEIIIFPFWVLFAVYFYSNYRGYKKSILLKNLKVTTGFLFVTALYFGLRLFLFPLELSKNSNIELNLINFILKLKYRFFEFVNFFTDLFSLSFFPSNNRFLKGGLILFFSFLILWLFLKNTKKKWFIFLVFSMGCFLWPAFLKAYRTNYLYVVLPFYILILFFLIKFFETDLSLIKKKHLKLILIIFICLIIIFNGYRLVNDLKIRENFYHKIGLAFKDLASNEKVKDRVLCFICIPGDVFANGISQACWLNGINKKLPIYFDHRTGIFYDYNFSHNYLKIIPLISGFRFITKDIKKMWFADAWRGHDFVMGKRIINNIKDEKVADISLIFDDKYIKQNLLFITWDYEKFRFKVLDFNIK